MGTENHIAKVSVMKKLKEKAARLTISIAKKGLKNDLESTGSTWNFQPKLPVKQDPLKQKR